MGKVTERIEGVVIGAFLGFGDEAPLVVFPGNPEETALPARVPAALRPQTIVSETRT